MPANLPPAYHAAEERYRAAKGVAERLAALEEMLRQLPRHKGTDKLHADLRSRLAKLRREPRRSGAARHSWAISREGAAQVALVGPPNSGKSALVDRLTRAAPEVAPYPFTTRQPVAGMMPFEDVAFQLIDLPPLSDLHVEPWVYDLVRGADLLWLVLEVEGALEGLELVRRLLAERRIDAFPAGGGLPERRPGAVTKPALLVVTGLDRPAAAATLEIVRELLEEPWPLLPVSAVDGQGLEELKRRTFAAAAIMRVYTKQPGRPVDREAPFTLPLGATVADLAAVIHQDLLANLRFARVWGPSAFDGQTVQRDHVLAEGDAVEIHA